MLNGVLSKDNNAPIKTKGIKKSYSRVIPYLCGTKLFSSS